MARQAGPLFFTGTIGDLIFYKIGENYYVRQKGEPTTGTQKQLKDPNCYPVLNMRKREFGAASRLASKVYRQLPKAERKHGVHGKLTSMALRLLREGKTAEDIKALALPLYLGKAAATIPEAPTPAVLVEKEEVCESIQPGNIAPVGKPVVSTALLINGQRYVPVVETPVLPIRAIQATGVAPHLTGSLME